MFQEVKYAIKHLFSILLCNHCKQKLPTFLGVRYAIPKVTLDRFLQLMLVAQMPRVVNTLTDFSPTLYLT